MNVSRRMYTWISSTSTCLSCTLGVTTCCTYKVYTSCVKTFSTPRIHELSLFVVYARCHVIHAQSATCKCSGFLADPRWSSVTRVDIHTVYIPLARTMSHTCTMSHSLCAKPHTHSVSWHAHAVVTRHDNMHMHNVIHLHNLCVHALLDVHMYVHSRVATRVTSLALAHVVCMYVALVCHVTRAREAIVLGCRVRSMSCHISCPKVSQCAKCTSANVPGFLPFCKFYTMSFRVGRSCKSHVCRVRSVLLHVVRLCVYILKVKSCALALWHRVLTCLDDWMNVSRRMYTCKLCTCTLCIHLCIHLALYIALALCCVHSLVGCIHFVYTLL